MKFGLKKPEIEKGSNYSVDSFQRLALGGMLVLTILTFVGSNVQAILWRSSDWLVSTVLPSMVVQLTNDERTNLSESPLTRSAVLDAAAQMKADDMAKNQYFAHFAPDGTSPWHWFDKAGYTYAYAGENLAIHFTDSSEVVTAWMNSPKHRENIVNKNFTQIGVGTAKGTYEGYDTVYVVQLFGTPAIVPIVKTASAPVAKATPAPTSVRKPIAKPAPVPVTKTATTTKSETVLAKTDANIPTEITAREEDTTKVASTSAKSSDIVVVPASNEEKTVSETNNGVVVETQMISTSSGLAVANIVEGSTTANNAGKAGLATRPNKVLQIVYILFGFIVVGLLIASVVVEARKTRYVQRASGIGLLVIMVGLWYINVLLTSGATIV